MATVQHTQTYREDRNPGQLYRHTLWANIIAGLETVPVKVTVDRTLKGRYVVLATTQGNGTAQ